MDLDLDDKKYMLYESSQVIVVQLVNLRPDVETFRSFDGLRKTRVWLESSHVICNIHRHRLLMAMWLVEYHVTTHSHVGTLVAGATQCFGLHSRAPRILKRARRIFAYSGYLLFMAFRHQKQSSFTSRRVPERQSASHFECEKRKKKKTRMVLSRRSNCPSSSTKLAVASPPQIRLLCSYSS